MEHKAATRAKQNVTETVSGVKDTDGRETKTSLKSGVLQPIRMMMPPVIAMRDFFVLSSPPQLVHFIPMQATPRPATVTIMLTIMRARVAWRAPG